MNSKLFVLAFTFLLGALTFAPVFAQTNLPATTPESAQADSKSVAPTVAETTVGILVQTATDLLPDKTGDSKSATTKAQVSPIDKGKGRPQKQKNFAITFDDIKFDMKKTDKFDRKMLNDKINGYHGGKVKIRGYIRPNLKQDGIKKFIFVRDNKECCFGEGAAIFDNILVRMAKNKTTRYTVRPITIEGNFVLKEYIGPSGEVWSLYRMYDAEVK